MTTITNKPGLDKQRMAANFNVAAENYESMAELQALVGKGLFDRLEVIALSPHRILDMGSGTGMFSRKLANRYPKTQVVQLDIAEKMLRVARSQERRFFSRQLYVCADAEYVPVGSETVDMVFSNLMLQWSSSPDRLFDGLFRILQPGGVLVFSTFGPDTLRELRESWAAVDDHAHVHTFIDMHDLGDALIRAGFVDPVIEVDYITLTYNDVSGLLQDLRRLGAGNVDSSRRKSLTGKQRYTEMYLEYEKNRRDGKLPATYEVIFGHAWVPAVKGRKPTSDGEFSVSLESLRKTLKKNT